LTYAYIFGVNLVTSTRNCRD